MEAKVLFPIVATCFGLGLMITEPGWAAESKSPASKLIEYNIVEQPGISLKYPHDWVVSQDFQMLPNGRPRSHTLGFKFFTRNGSGKKAERHLGVRIGANREIGFPKAAYQSESFAHLFDKTLDATRIIFYENKTPENVSWRASITCDAGSIDIDYSLLAEEAALLKKSDRKIPAELDDFASNIVCRSSPQK